MHASAVREAGLRFLNEGDELTFEVEDGSSITASSGSTSVYIDVGWEELYVKAVDGNKLKKVFMPVPYNIGFELSLLTKLNDDALQVVEQILPFFQPSFSITIN